MKNKEIYKYLMHMEEVIYDLKRSIDRMRKPKDKDEELWERVKNAAPGEWVCIDPESHVSGFIRYARDAGDIISQTNPELVKVYNDDEFTAMKLNASMSRAELIELIHKLRAKINEMTPLRPINTYGPDFKPAPPKRTMKELEGETPIQGI